jgi:hypothetical protein
MINQAEGAEVDRMNIKTKFSHKKTEPNRESGRRLPLLRYSHAYALAGRTQPSAVQ